MVFTALTVSGIVLAIVAPIAMAEVFRRLPDPEWLPADRFPVFPPVQAPVRSAEPRGMRTGLMNLAAAIPPAGVQPLAAATPAAAVVEEPAVLLE